MSVTDDLLNAARIMGERGYCQGVLEDDQGRVCALGAIGLATAGYIGGHSTRRGEAAVNALARHLGGVDGSRTVWQYNDSLGFRAKQKMVKTMREAAHPS